MKAIVIIAVIILSGCASTRTVYVPVSSCPEPPQVSMPVLVVDQLPKQPTTDQALKALAADYVTMKTEINRLIILLDAYRKQPVK